MLSIIEKGIKEEKCTFLRKNPYKLVDTTVMKPMLWCQIIWTRRNVQTTVCVFVVPDYSKPTHLYFALIFF